MPKTAEPTELGLTVSSPAEVDPSARFGRVPYLPWVAAALLGSGGTVLLGWAAIGVVVAAGWLTMTALPPAVVLDTIAQVWIGVHGVPFAVAGLTISLTPLGASAVLVVAVAAVARYAVSQRTPDTKAPLVVAARVAGVCTAAYALAAWLLATLVGTPRQAAGVFVGAAVIAAVGSVIGAFRGAGVRLPRWAPSWLRGALAGSLGGLIALVLASSATLALAIVSHLDQITLLHAALAPDAVGSVLLLLGYLAYAPTLVLWAGAYALGAGFSVGTDTLLTPWVSQLGLLPVIPIAGAVPSVPPVLGWALVASGPLAGAAAGLVASRRMRLDAETVRLRDLLVGAGLAGLLAGLVWTSASALSRGSLGAVRLVDLGPRLPELLFSGTLPIAGAAVLAALGRELSRRHRLIASADPTAEEDS